MFWRSSLLGIDITSFSLVQPGRRPALPTALQVVCCSTAHTRGTTHTSTATDPPAHPGTAEASCLARIRLGGRTASGETPPPARPTSNPVPLQHVPRPPPR